MTEVGVGEPANVSFEACGNAKDNMARNESRKPEEVPLFAEARVVQAGVVSLIELKNGWKIVRSGRPLHRRVVARTPVGD